MKPKFFTSILLFISAYSPLFLIFAVKDFDFKTKKWFSHEIPIYILFATTIFSIIILFVFVKTIKRGNMRVEVVEVKNRSVDIINYTIPYMLAFFGVDLAEMAQLISIMIFLFIMLILTITTKSFFINPILAIFGYGLYDLDYNFDGKQHSTIVISKHDLKTGDLYYIRNLTRFLYFVTEECVDHGKQP